MTGPRDLRALSRRALLALGTTAVAGGAALSGAGMLSAKAVPAAKATQRLMSIPRGRWVDVRRFGARGDGRHDDSAAVRRALARVPAAGGVLYFPRGRYLIDTLYVSRSNVLITGDGTFRSTLVRRAGKRVDPRLVAVNSRGPLDTARSGAHVTNVHVSHLHLDGNNAAVSAVSGSSTVVGTLFFGLVSGGSVSDVRVTDPREAGVNVFGSNDVEIVRVLVDGMRGDFQVNSINVAGDWFRGDPGWKVNQYPSRRITVRACHVVRNWAAPQDSAAGGGISICVQGSSSVQVLNCTVDLSGEPAARGRNGGGIVFEGGGPVGASLLGKDLRASGNRVVHCAVGIGGIDTNPGPNTTGILRRYEISGNRIDDCDQGIQVNGQGVQVRRNVVSAVTPLVIGTIKATDERNMVIAENTFRSVGRACIETIKTASGGRLSGVTITGNTMDGSRATDAANGYGIVTHGRIGDFVISGNLIENTLAAGIYLATTDPAVRAEAGRISGNRLNNCCRSTALQFPSYFGVVSAGSERVVVEANRITGGAGLRAATASVNGPRMTVRGNTAAAGRTASDLGSRRG